MLDEYKFGIPIDLRKYEFKSKVLEKLASYSSMPHYNLEEAAYFRFNQLKI